MVKLLTKHSEKFDAVALKLGRAGFASRGFIWASVGIIAVVAAFTGDDAKGTQGALEVIASRNGGIVFLILITLGIICYSSWRFFEGLYGLRIDPKASNFQKVINGVVTPFASCIAYLIFAAANIDSIITGKRNSGSSNILGKIASPVIGKIFLTLIAIILFITAIMWCLDLFNRKPLRDLDMKRASKRPYIKILLITFCYLGTFGRAILFALLGTLFLRICYADGINGGGFGVALQQLQYNTTARIFLVFFGFLIFNFGIFSCFQAVFKRFFPYHPHLLEKHRQGQHYTTKYFGPSTKEVNYEGKLDDLDVDRKNQENKEKMHGVVAANDHGEYAKKEEKEVNAMNSIKPAS